MLSTDALNSLPTLSCGASPKLLFEDAISLLTAIAPDTSSHLERSFATVTLRAIETRLLSEPRMRSLAQNWESLLGQADDIIADVLTRTTGRIPDAMTVRYFKDCVRSKASRTGEKDSIPRTIVSDAVARVIKRTNDGELRCESCGYHFRAEDIGQERRDAIAPLKPTFAKYWHPKRLTDALKPTEINGRSITALTIDHITPEAGFGWTSLSNLAVLCEFCNRAKLIYRSPFEPISTVIAASLQALPASRPHSLPRQVAVWALIGMASVCSACGGGSTTVELTVVLPTETNGSRWLGPRAAHVICFECLPESN